MTDIFFSYSSKDRDRLRAVHAAPAAQGFEIFWDQSVPPGTDWDTWIRQHLNEAKCAIVFWSSNSVGSDNVRHEATVAKQQGKLVPVLLDPLAADQFPMGLYSVQGANLTAWAGDEQHDGWLRLQHEVESKLTPLWVRRQIDTLEAELVAERARRDGAERRDRTLREQIVKEAQELTRERDEAREELSAVKARLAVAERNEA
jgi:TIR domain